MRICICICIERISLSLIALLSDRFLEQFFETKILMRKNVEAS